MKDMNAVSVLFGLGATKHWQFEMQSILRYAVSVTYILDFKNLIWRKKHQNISLTFLHVKGYMNTLINYLKVNFAFFIYL
jgi:hypothetical protein